MSFFESKLDRMLERVSKREFNNKVPYPSPKTSKGMDEWIAGGHEASHLFRTALEDEYDTFDNPKRELLFNLSRSFAQNVEAHPREFLANQVSFYDDMVELIK